MFELNLSDIEASEVSLTDSICNLLSGDIPLLSAQSSMSYDLSQTDILRTSELLATKETTVESFISNASDPLIQSQLDLAGNTLTSARNITLSSTPTTYTDWVGRTDTNDYYRFEVTESSQFNVSLTGLTSNANVQLLNSGGTRLIESKNVGTTPETINAQLFSGTYYVRVYPAGKNDNTNYDLTLSATPIVDAGNTRTTARNITLSPIPTTYTDWVGRTDTNDYYRFEVAQNSRFNLSLTGLTNNANVQVLNSRGTKLFESINTGTTSETINAQLTSGIYYIRVYPSLRSNNTAYNLTVSASPVRSTFGYNHTNGYGSINAAAAVAQAIGQTPFTDIPNLGGNDRGADLVKAPEVWTQGYTGQGVVVAVLDTGVDRNHPDLKANIWRNSAEIAGDGIDNDNNGYVDDVYGWNFNGNNNNTLDGHSHGTHVAGTIAAIRNSIGVTGIAYNAKIMPVKVVSDNGSGDYEDVAAGIRYAVDNGADIISMSLGGNQNNQSLRSAVEYAASHGVIVVMAAGNAGSSTTLETYPASYATHWGIAAGAVDRYNQLASFSNRSGSTPLTYLTAPGSSIYSTLPNNRYGTKSGTSMATPHITGVAALMLSANPNLTEWEVVSLLTSTAGNLLLA